MDVGRLGSYTQTGGLSDNWAIGLLGYWSESQHAMTVDVERGGTRQEGQVTRH